jgi:hypothetical protein
MAKGERMQVPGIPASGLRWPVAAAVLVNLVPIAGVAFWGWSAFALIFLYWLENLVIGARTVGAMLSTAAFGGVKAIGAMAIAGFFTIHYGMFCFVHGTFVVTLFGGEAVVGDSMFDLAGAAQMLFAREPGLYAGLAAIVLWQAVGLGLFLARGEAKQAQPLTLMASPYPRIIVLHLTLIFGGFLLMLLNQPLAGLVLLALIKTGFDAAEAMGKGFRFDLLRRVAEAPPPTNRP